mmetsp:Transcript_162071/g.519672  ORF Transcript_162071/g.519672 Transcript_162071/m.519672 type:complete len:971 (+) Transcript_162071:80-2992(+)
MVATCDLWEVTGGAEKGGIIVRSDKDISSQEASSRLATGALVRAVEQDNAAGRLKYQLLSGDGPETGWVSTQVRGKELLAKLSSQLQQGLGLHVEREAVRAKLDEISALRQDLPIKGFCGGFEDASTEEDSDGEGARLCTQCRLPLGERAYTAGSSGRRLVHGECMAQRMLHAMRDQEAIRRGAEAEQKSRRRAEFGIGWSADVVPCNGRTAVALGFGVEPAPRLCCLVLEEAARAVRVAPTEDPAAAVNLEYLAVALAVRRREGREPRFSLDPVERLPTSIEDESLMQVKRFEPRWLAGTSVGEVLFQADYYLKELSMGEYHQPVVGMRSCFDFAQEEGCETHWSAREWFFVRKAEVQMSEDGSLTPCLSMGVEAREQIRGSEGMEDATITRADHPLVRYAEEFTRNFNIIAERRSVIFHLRELAKASVLAKFLGEAEISLCDTWFNFDAEVKYSVHLEIPQLWNRQCHSKVRVEDGEIVDAEKGIGSRMHGVYGGVDFGLSRFNLSAVAPGRAAPPLPERRMLALGAFHTTRAWGGERVPALVKKDRFPQARVPRAPRLQRGAELRELRGVDLSLDGFELSEMKRVSAPAQAGSWGGLVLGDSFWDVVDGDDAAGLEEEDWHLLRSIFNPQLSDRRSEGGRFVPPVAHFGYVHKLRDLAKQEELVLQQRQDHFLSSDFAMDRAGPLFPWTWTSSFEVLHRQAAPPPGAWLEERPEFRDEPVLGHLLKGAAPVFDKDTEDGVKFRIYRFGTLEVRSILDLDEVERIGAVYSVRAPDHSKVNEVLLQRVDQQELVTKVTEYVERVHRSTVAGIAANDDQQPFCRRFFVLFKTAQGNVILTERLANGRSAWEENPGDLEDRRSLGRVLRCVDFPVAGTSVGELEALYAREAHGAAPGVCSTSRRKRYARDAYAWAFGAGAPPRRAVAVMKAGDGRPARAGRQQQPQHQPLQQVRLGAECLQKNVFGSLFAD